MKYLSILFCLVFVWSANGQDFHFTNNNLFQGYINPGWQDHKVDFSAGFIYRNQGFTVTNNEFNTYGTQINARIKSKTILKRLHLSGLILSDRSGSGGLNTNFGSMGASYGIPWDESERHHSSIGGRLGLRSFQNGKVKGLHFEEQLLGGMFTENYSFPNIKKMQWDLGIYHSSKITELLKFSVGGSIGLFPRFHSDLNTNSSSYRYCGIINLDIGLNEFFIVSHGIIYQKINEFQQLTIQGITRYQLPSYNNLAIKAGLGIRRIDALQILFGGEIENWKVGLSYEINTSPLRQASQYNSAVELGLIYKINYKNRQQKLIRFKPDNKEIELYINTQRKTISEEGQINLTLVVELFSPDSTLLEGTSILYNYDIQREEQKEITESNTIEYQLEKNRRYLYTFDSPEYFKDSFYLSTYGIQIDSTIHKKLYLKKKEKLNPIRVEIGKPVRLNNIYYDLDDYKILPASENQLDVIYRALIEYPEMIIEISSHTDSQGEDAYNLNLSILRAKSVINWLVEKGINESRLKFKGFGETQLLNNCENGIPCTDEEHRINRRTEFKIIEGPEVIYLK